jgi:hypothetical protein
MATYGFPNGQFEMSNEEFSKKGVRREQASLDLGQSSVVSCRLNSEDLAGFLIPFPIQFLQLHQPPHVLDVELLLPLPKIVELLLLWRAAQAVCPRQGADASH